MALQYDLGSVNNWQDLCRKDEDGEINGVLPITEIIIYMTMAVGINEITERNVEDFYLRYRMLRHQDDAFSSEQRGDYYVIEEDGSKTEGFIELADIVRHVGLKTNASNRTLRGFYAKLAEDHFLLSRRRETRKKEEAKA